MVLNHFIPINLVLQFVNCYFFFIETYIKISQCFGWVIPSAIFPVLLSPCSFGPFGCPMAHSFVHWLQAPCGLCAPASLFCLALLRPLDQGSSSWSLLIHQMWECESLTQNCQCSWEEIDSWCKRESCNENLATIKMQLLYLDIIELEIVNISCF